MKRYLTITALGLTLALGVAGADTVDDLLAEYQAQGAGAFTAEAGATLWRLTHPVGGESRQCADCHGADLTTAGRHQRTGKTIEPMAPSANPGRLIDAGKIEKWFYRNCKWTLGRPCSPQEKGDVLVWLRTL
jgi:hypothetical protein